jgi:alpha-ribazole phosphatase
MGGGRAELLLIRHAPVAGTGRLFGRTDLDAEIDPDAVAPLRAILPEVGTVATSPARRCHQTARALWPEIAAEEDTRLWEQDFGVDEGRAFADLPDLGVRTRAELARHAAPGGESFADLCTRVAPALTEWSLRADGGPVALVVHAGVIRAALGQVLGVSEAGLAFVVPPLSLTRLGVGPAGPISILATGVVA